MKNVIIFAASLLLASCNQKQDSVSELPQETSFLEQQETSLPYLYTRLYTLSGTSQSYLEGKHKFQLLSQKAVRTESEEQEVSALKDFLEINYATFIIKREDIDAYVIALSKLTKNIKDEKLQNTYKEELEQIAPGSNPGSYILEASKNLLTMADTLEVLSPYKDHFLLLDNLLKYKNEARGI